jgi:Hypoxia induced protein conserved region
MTIMTALVVLALLATVAALVSGIVSMAHGGGFDRRHSHQIMFARVGLQGATLVILLIAIWLAAR